MMIMSRVFRSLPPSARQGAKLSAPGMALSLTVLCGLLLMLLGVVAPAQAQTAPVIKSAQLDAPNGPGITVGNRQGIGLTITGSWSTAGLKVLVDGYPYPYATVYGSTVQALKLTLPTFMAPGAVAVKIANNYGTSAQIGFYASAPLLIPAQVSAVRNADKSVTLTFSVGNTTEFMGFNSPLKGCYAPEVIMTSARLGTSTVSPPVPGLFVGNLATNPTLGQVISGPFQLTFPASVGAKGTTVKFTLSGTYQPNHYVGSITSPYPWGGSLWVVLP